MAEKKQKQKRKIIRRSTKFGYLNFIPISDDPNGPHVMVRSETWQQLLHLGIYPVLELSGDGYVMVYCPKYTVRKRLARLIKNANSDQTVSVINGDELDLRDENIQVIDPPPPKPPTYDRTFLSTDDFLYYVSMVDYETIYDNPNDPTNIDPRWEAYNKLCNEQRKAGMI